MEGSLLPRGSAHHAAADAPAAGNKKRSRQQAALKPEPQLFSSTFKRHLAKPSSKPAKPLAAPSKQDPRSTLTFSRISVGQKFLGVVKSTGAHHVTLSLPNNLSAVLNWSEVSDEHLAAFESGQALPDQILPVHSFVRCVVLAKTDEAGAKALRVSCRASVVNRGITVVPGDVVYGSVRSLEDHGQIVNLGQGRLAGFLPGSDNCIKVGQPVEALVVSVKNNVATLDFASPEALAQARLRDRKGLNLASLQPGILVDVDFDRDLFDGGQLVKFLGMFTGTIDPFHQSPHSGGSAARVLWVDPANKLVGLSTLPHIVQRNGAMAADLRVALGTELVQDALVTRVHKHVGLSLALPCPAFAHASRLVDDAKAERPEMTFKPGQKVKARVVGECLADGVLLVSLQPSVLDAAVLSYAELRPGTVVQGEIIKVDPGFGLIVKLGLHVRGLVPLLHLSDAEVQDVERRFKLGQVVKARVLACDAGKERCQLTLKKTLVGSSLTVADCFAACKPGMVMHGMVSKAQEFGVIVGFFGNVHGLVPAHTLGAAAADPAGFYKPGQVLKVRVVQVDAAREKMLLSLDTSAKAAESSAAAGEGKGQGKAAELQPATVLTSCVVVAVAADGLTVEFDGRRKGFCPAEHLSDHPEMCAELLNALQPGAKLKPRLGVLLAPKAPGKRGFALVSFKPELVRRAGLSELPWTVEMLEPEALVSGYVVQMNASGVFVRFADTLTALVPSPANVADDLKGHALVLGQTVRASVTSIDTASGRVVACLKHSVVGSRGTAPHLESLFADLKRAHASSPLLKLRLGQQVHGEVQLRREGEGVVVQLDGGGPQGFCVPSQAPSPLPQTGSQLDCRVLDLDLSSTMADLCSGRKSLEAARWRRPEEAGCEDVEARVELAKAKYAVVSYALRAEAEAAEEDERVLAHLATCGFNGSLASPPLTVGCTAHVRLVEGFEACELLPEKARGRARARSGSLSEWLGPRADVVVGATVTARVSNIKGTWLSCELRGDKKKPLQGRIHSCDVMDPIRVRLRPATSTHPGAAAAPASQTLPKLREGCVGAFASHSVGDFVNAKVVAVEAGTAYLSLRPSEMFAGTKLARLSWDSPLLKVGATLDAWIDGVASDGLQVGLSRNVRGFCFCTDVCEDPAQLDMLFNKGEASAVFPIGRPVKTKISSLDRVAKKCTVQLVFA